jgi:hypothetical protein
MAGGLLQLVAYGAQDVYISGNPHITFWKILYKRHTNFAMEAFRVNFTGAPAFGQRVVAVVNRNADLIGRTYLEIKLPVRDTNGTKITTNFWNDSRGRLGYNLIKQVEVEIGGQIIDRHYGEWLYLWEALTATSDEKQKLYAMLSEEVVDDEYTSRGILYVPLQFWFCRNPGLALPLIALQYHEVRFNVTFNDVVNVINNENENNFAETGIGAGRVNLCPTQFDASLYIDYVYLDTEERRRFAQQSHEYLIEQLQINQESITHPSSRIDLTLNHPVKELVWVFQDARLIDCSNNQTVGVFQYSDIVDRCRLQLNGQDRFEERYGDYFWKVQPYQHHSGYPGYTSTTRVNVYSFALKPEEHQPSGTCNFSRIDNATLVFDSRTTDLWGERLNNDVFNNCYPTKETPHNFTLYAVNYNILRIMSGMGGLAYSN